MNKYAVSLVWIKDVSAGKQNISNNLHINIQANNETDAFGIAFDKSKELHPEHNLFSKCVIKQD